MDFISLCLKWQQEVSQLLSIIQGEASVGEFAAFIAYAISFPDSFLALVDTYDVMRYGTIDSFTQYTSSMKICPIRFF